MKKFRLYVVGAATYLTIEHSAESAEDVLAGANRSGFVSAVALERNGRRRNVVVPLASIALIADGEDQGLRIRPAIRPGSRRLS